MINSHGPLIPLRLVGDNEPPLPKASPEGLNRLLLISKENEGLDEASLAYLSMAIELEQFRVLGLGDGREADVLIDEFERIWLRDMTEEQRQEMLRRLK